MSGFDDTFENPFADAVSLNPSSHHTPVSSVAEQPQDEPVHDPNGNSADDVSGVETDNAEHGERDPLHEAADSAHEQPEPEQPPAEPATPPPRAGKGRRSTIGSSVRKSASARDWTSRLEHLELDNDAPLGPLGGSDMLNAESLDDGDNMVGSGDDKNAGAHGNGSPAARPRQIRHGSRTEGRSRSGSQTAAATADTAPAAPIVPMRVDVGDPHRVGDITSAHTEYKVTTRTKAPQFSHEETDVQRRYRDFLWLYNALVEAHPGIIVPPPPEKQAVGRFEESFVQARKNALQTMISKIAANPVLQLDPNTVLFLQSETLSVDIKQIERERIVPPEVRHGAGGHGASSLMSTLGFSSAVKFVEPDSWFDEKKNSLDTLEGQLKALSKSIDTVLKQRKGLAEAVGELGDAFSELSGIELDQALGECFAILSEIQTRIMETYQRQTQHDCLTLGVTIDEYTRIIGSIRAAFHARQKAWVSWQLADGDLAKRRAALEKARRQGKTQQDRLGMLEAEIDDAEKRCHQLHIDFDQIGRSLQQELDKFEFEKLEDFRNGVEIFLEGAVESQKELVEIWETYLKRVEGLLQ